MIDKKKSALLLFFGAIFSLVREVIILKLLGDGYESDVFRASYSLPNFFLQTIGTLFVTFSLGVFYKEEDKMKSTYYYQSVMLFSLFTLIAIITVPIQLLILYPGIDLSDGLITSSMIAWGVFFLGSLTLMPRAYLNIEGYKFAGSTVQLIRGGVFSIIAIVIFYINNNVSALELILISVFCSLLMVVTHFYGIVKLASFNWSGVFGCSKVWRDFFGIAIVYQLLVSASRFIDRNIASNQNGLMNLVEFAYGSYTIPMSIVLSFFSIAILPRLLSKRNLNINIVTMLILLPVLGCISLVIYHVYSLFFDYFRYFFGSISAEGVESLFEISKVMFPLIPFCTITLLYSHWLLAKKMYKRLISISIIKVFTKVVVVLFLKTDLVSIIIYSFLISEVVVFLFVFILIIRGDDCADNYCRNA